MTIKRKEEYEQTIENYVIELVSKGDFKLKKELSGLPTIAKRLTTLYWLDPDEKSFLKLLDVAKNAANKAEYIKHLVNMYREYVKVSDVEKKIFGEVMTPISLVEEMLDTLPKDVWSNPDLKWLDPANGVGIFPAVIVERLMDGLKDIITDDEKRYRHIMENMIFVDELQGKNAFLFITAFDPLNEYDLNIYNGNFLEDGFKKHCDEIWGVEKFDIIVGNPPYNEEFSNSGTAIDLFDKFIINTINISDIVLMITPSRWFSKKSLVYLRNKLTNGHLKSISHYNNASVFFTNTEITGGVSYFLYDNINKYNTTLFNKIPIDLNKQIEIIGSILYNQENYNIIESIITKILSHNTHISNFNSQGYFKIKTNNIQQNGETICYYSEQKGKKHNLPIKDGRFYSYANTYSDTKNVLNKWKVLTSSAYGANPKGLGKINIISPNEICSESFIFFDFKTKIEAINFKNYLETNFSKFIIAIKKNKQHVTSTIFSILPKLNFNEKWDDEKLYKYFNLTEKEIEVITENVTK